MNAAQKGLSVVGLLAMGIAAVAAPFSYRGHNELARLVGREVTLEGSYHAPAWSGAEAAPDKMRAAYPTAEHFYPSLDEVHLDVGKLGLTWAAIAAVATVAVVLASGATKPPMTPPIQ